MDVQVSKIRKIRGQPEGLDNITVFVEDPAPGKGKIIIECYGKSWSLFWPAMGDKKLGEFFQSCGNDYLIGCLAPGLSPDRSTDDPALIRKKLLKDLELNVGSLTALRVEELKDLVESTPDELIEWDKLAALVYGEEWFLYPMPTEEDRDYSYLSRIVDGVKNILEYVDGLVL